MSHLVCADDSILFTGASTMEFEAVFDILKIYKKASGQIVNFKKSCITFSPNIGENAKKNKFLISSG